MTMVHELEGFTEASLAASFGATAASFLASLPTGGPWEDVRERGPPKSITCERSFPPATSEETVRGSLGDLAQQLYPRLMQVLSTQGALSSKCDLNEFFGCLAILPVFWFFQSGPLQKACADMCERSRCSGL